MTLIDIFIDCVLIYLFIGVTLTGLHMLLMWLISRNCSEEDIQRGVDETNKRYGVNYTPADYKRMVKTWSWRHVLYAVLYWWKPVAYYIFGRKK